MKTKTRWPARLALAGLGALGITIAHWAAYLGAASDPHAHRELLDSTGHRYWPIVGAFLVALIVGTLGVSISARMRRSHSGASTLSRDALILAGLQVGGFLLMEVGERLLFASHHQVGSLLSEPVLWIGVALQLVVAVAGALVLRLLRRAVRFVRSLLRSSPRTSSRRQLVTFFSSQIHAPRLAPGISSPALRGPPSFALI